MRALCAHTLHTYSGEAMKHTKANTNVRIKIRSVINDETTGKFFAEIAFENIDEKLRTIMVPMSTLDDIKHLSELLGNAGARINPRNELDISLLKNLKVQIAAAPRASYAQAVGWYSGRKCFVMPTHVIDKRSVPGAILPPKTDVSDHNHAKPMKGSRKAWLASVGNSAKYSSRMVAAVTAALAAPLLKRVNLPSFTIHIYGKSRAGKSSAILAGASIIGFRQESDLPNFRGTETAWEEIPAAFNDMFLPINELGLLKGTAAQRYQALVDVTYGIAENRGKTLSLKSRPEHDRAKPEWSCIAMANGEESADDIAHAAGRIRRDGELFRWIGLPAISKSAINIFDRVPKTIADNKRTAWALKHFKIVRRGARKNAGSLGDFYIRKLIKKHKVIPKKIRTLMSEFQTEHNHVNSVERDIGKNFALLFAAGILAIRMKVLDWPERVIHDSISQCFRDAIGNLRTEDRLLRRGKADLRKMISSSTVIDLRNKSRPVRKAFPATCEGFIEKRGKKTTITIVGVAFKNCFRDSLSSKLILDWLADAGRGVNFKTRAQRGSDSIKWAESQPEWPDGKRHRSIVFHCPKSFLPTK